MSWVYGLTVHERTAAHDGFDPTRATLGDSLWRDTAGAERTMEPDVLHAALECWTGDLYRNGRMRGDHDGVHGAWHRTKIGVALHALDL